MEYGEVSLLSLVSLVPKLLFGNALYRNSCFGR